MIVYTLLYNPVIILSGFTVGIKFPCLFNQVSTHEKFAESSTLVYNYRCNQVITWWKPFLVCTALKWNKKFNHLKAVWVVEQQVWNWFLLHIRKKYFFKKSIKSKIPKIVDCEQWHINAFIQLASFGDKCSTFGGLKCRFTALTWCWGFALSNAPLEK